MIHRAPAFVLLACLAFTGISHAQTKPADVGVTREEWTDASRDRKLPVKIYTPAPTDAKWPIVLISHGLGGSRESMTYVGDAWARAGFLVVAVQHPGSDESLWRDKKPADVLPALQGAISAENYILRCEDVSFAIDHLGELAKSDGRFKGKLNLDHVGLAGHSFGAQTVQGIVGQTFPAGRTLRDTRVKAAIAFSPGLKKEANAQKAFAEVNVPIFHFTGTADQAPLVRDLTPEERRIPYDHITHNDQYLLIFKDGDHAVFNGIPQQRRRLMQNNGISVEQYQAWHKLIIESSTQFWDAYLRDDAKAKASLQRFGDALGDAGTFEQKSSD